MTPKPPDDAPPARPQGLIRGLARFRRGLGFRSRLTDVYLAVDVDVIQMFLSPRRGAGYTALHYTGAGGQVEQEEMIAAAALASALARYILFELPKQCANKSSMLLMPSHAKELINIYGAKQRDAARLAAETADRIESLTSAAAKLHTPGEGSLSQYVDEIVEMLFGADNLFDELLRMKNLVESDALIHLERFRFESGQFVITQDDAIYDERLARFADKVEIDRRVLASRDHPRFLGTREEANKIHDLEALAAIPPDGPLVRIVTGAGRIRKLAKSVGADAFRQDIDEVLIEPLSFLPALFNQVCGEAAAQEQIRRVTGTIDQLLFPLFERTMAGTRLARDDFEGWLSSLHRGDTEVVDAAMRVIDGEPDFPDRAARAWEDLAKILFVGGDDLLIHGAQVKLELQRLASPGTERRLHERLNELLTQRTDEMHQAATPAFLSGLLAASVPRNAPPLRLGDMPAAQEVARRIGKRVSQREDPDMAALIRNALADDRRQYARYLLVAMSFTIVGLWKNAEWAFEEAYRRAPMQIGEDDVITGSEAAYGKAVSRRILSRHPRSLLDAQTYLRHAVERSTWKLGAISRDVRFESEELSQWVVYRWLASSAISADEQAPPPFKFQILDPNRALKPSHALANLVLEIEELGATIESDPLVREYVLQQLLCNAFQASWLDRYRFSFSYDGRSRRIEVFMPIAPAEDLVSEATLQRLSEIFTAQCARLERSSTDTDAPLASQLARFICALAELQFAKGLDKRAAFERFQSVGVDTAKVMPIDGVRYEVMRRIGEQFSRA